MAKILIIEDDADHCALVAQALKLRKITQPNRHPTAKKVCIACSLIRMI